MFGYSGKVDHLLMPQLALVVQKLNTVSPATRIHFKLCITLSVFQYSVLIMMGVAYNRHGLTAQKEPPFSKP